MEDLEAEYVVVGVGAAGALLVSQLADAGFSVIGIEAGENRSEDEMIRNSLFAGLEFGLEENALPVYLYSQIPVRNGSLVSAQKDPCSAVAVGCNKITVPGFNGKEESDADKAPETVGIYTTGKVLGGGSAINGLQYSRGTGYDEWAKVGGSRWSIKNIYEQFRKLENYNGLSGISDSHMSGGQLNIRQAPNIPPSMTKKFLQALQQGLEISQIKNDDYNDPNTPIGSFAKWQLFQYPDGCRASSEVSFLPEDILMSNSNANQAASDNILILFKAMANHLLWENKCSDKSKTEVVGVQVIHNGQSRRVYATKGVILCAGVFSAELLQRSGVGPTRLLECLNIPVIYDNPHVGSHLKNHLFVPILFSANKNDKSLPDDDLESLYTGGAFLASLLPEDNARLRGYQLIGGSPKTGIFLVILIYLQPHSEGIVQIQSSNPLSISLVDNNYLGDPLDTLAFVRAIREYILPLATSFSKIDAKYQLISPSPELIAADDLLIDFVKNSIDHTHHWSCSNKMASTSNEGVVDGNGAVYGVSNLYVADVSISPLINDGNTTAPAYAIAATIADYLINN